MTRPTRERVDEALRIGDAAVLAIEVLALREELATLSEQRELDINALIAECERQSAAETEAVDALLDAVGELPAANLDPHDFGDADMPVRYERIAQAHFAAAAVRASREPPP